MCIRDRYYTVHHVHKHCTTYIKLLYHITQVDLVHHEPEKSQKCSHVLQNCTQDGMLYIRPGVTENTLFPHAALCIVYGTSSALSKLLGTNN